MGSARARASWGRVSAWTAVAAATAALTVPASAQPAPVQPAEVEEAASTVRADGSAADPSPSFDISDAPPWQPAGKLVVLNRDAWELVVVDPVGHRVLARLPTGPFPHEVTVSADGRWAFVANYGADPAASGRGSVTVLDLERHVVHDTYLPGPYERLHDIRVGPSGKRLWLTAEADSGVLELDAATGDVLMLWKTGGAHSHTLVVGPSERRLWVANAGSDSVSLIDRLTVASRRVPTGRGPEGLALSPDGRELWVANRLDHTLTVIDAGRARRLATLASRGVEPVRLRFTPDGRHVWVAHAGEPRVTVFEARSRQAVAEVTLPAAPLSVLFSPDGRRAFVSLPSIDRVAMVDVAARRVVATVETGRAPDGMAWSVLPLQAGFTLPAAVR